MYVAPVLCSVRIFLPILPVEARSFQWAHLSPSLQDRPCRAGQGPSLPASTDLPAVNGSASLIWLLAGSAAAQEASSGKGRFPPSSDEAGV